MTFPVQLVKLVEQKGKRLGFNFNEYVRHILALDIREESEGIPMVDEETEARIGKALKDIKEGKYIDVDSKEELHELLGV